MPTHFNSSCCLSRREMQPQVTETQVILCSKWPPGDGLELPPRAASPASESRDYWVCSSFVPSELCLENQGLLGSNQSLCTEYPQLIQTRGNWTVIGTDLRVFLDFFFLLGMVFSLFLFTSQGLFEVGYLFIYALLLSQEPNCNLREEKKMCLWRAVVVEGGSQQIKVRERGLHLYQKTTSN